MTCWDLSDAQHSFKADVQERIQPSIGLVHQPEINNKSKEEKKEFEHTVCSEFPQRGSPGKSKKHSSPCSGSH